MVRLRIIQYQDQKQALVLVVVNLFRIYVVLKP